MKPPSPSAAGSSATDPDPAFARLNRSFRAYVRTVSAERQGWMPSPTPQGMAGAWGGLARHCDELLKASDVPPIFARFDIEGISRQMPTGFREVAAELVAMLDAPRIVAVGGPRGTGKTMLASGLIRLFCQCGRSALYRTAKGVMDEMGGAPWEQKEKIRRAQRSPDLLVIDEVQVRDDGRQWQDNELTELIDARYREAKATLLISNLTDSALRTNLGDSIWRRLVETGGLPIETGWKPLSVLRAERAAAARVSSSAAAPASGGPRP